MQACRALLLVCATCAIRSDTDLLQWPSRPYPPNHVDGDVNAHKDNAGWSGTLWIPGTDLIINPTDRSALQSITYTGTASRNMFDRRTGSFGWYTAHLFDVVFEDYLSLEAQVNQADFPTQALAEVEAVHYCTALGRIPHFLRAGAQSMWIHAGMEAFGGGNRNFLVHTGQGAYYDSWNTGNLEEAFLHEGGHTSIDWWTSSGSDWPIRVTDDPDWVAAQNEDDMFISSYAENYPGTPTASGEDVSESIGLWVGVRYRADRLTSIASTVTQIEQAIGNRLDYFDAQVNSGAWCMYPIEPLETCWSTATPTPTTPTVPTAVPTPTPTPTFTATVDRTLPTSCGARLTIPASVMLAAGLSVVGGQVCLALS